MSTENSIPANKKLLVHHELTTPMKTQKPPQQPKFAMDISLYRYAKQLRLLGCDVLCDENVKQQGLIEAAEQENRIVLTSVGKSIPLLYRFSLIGDLTFGKAFQNLAVIGRSKQIVQTVRKNRKSSKSHSGEMDDDDEDDGDNEMFDEEDENTGLEMTNEDDVKSRKSKKSANDDDDEGDSEQPSYFASLLGDVSSLSKNRKTSADDESDGENNNNNREGTQNFDARKFHWVDEEDPVSKKTKRRRRKLVGYNSDGESDYEYEEEKKTEAKLQKMELDQKNKDQKSLSTPARSANDEMSNVSSSAAKCSSVATTSTMTKRSSEQTMYTSLEDQTHQEIVEKLQALIITANAAIGNTTTTSLSTGSVAALAANALNSALVRSQRQHQSGINVSSKVRYIVVDIHANFKQMLSCIILIAGVGWIPTVLFTRCVKCNSKIQDVKKESVKDIVTPGIYRVYQNFYQCPSCKNVFWGVDNGLVVNFKSARTTEYLRSLFPEGFAADPMQEIVNSNSNSTATPERSRTHGGGGDDDDNDNDNENNDDGAVANNSQQKYGRQVVDSLGRLVVQPSASNKWGYIRRNQLFSLPRRIKVVLFHFMTNEELDILVVACPKFRELVERKKSGLDMKFIPDEKKKRTSFQNPRK